MYNGRPTPQSNHQQDASFPVMPIPDILECLAALNIPAQAEDIAKPTHLAAQHVYAGLVSELMGIPMDMIEGPKQSLMGMMEYKEMYNDALEFTMFFKHVRNLAEICGCRNFNLSDLTRPDPARFRYNVSGIINFAKFRDERAIVQQQLQDQVRQQGDKTERLRKQLAKAEAAIEDIKSVISYLSGAPADDPRIRSAADQPKMETSRARNEQLRAELLELRNSQIRLSHDVEESKKERTTYNELAVNEFNQVTVQISSARSRLVQSPERIKKHINEMSYNVSQEKATLGAFQRKTRELGNRVDVINTLEMDLRGLIDLEKGIEDQRAKVEEARRAMLTLRARLEGKNIESQGLTTKLQQLERQLQNAADRQKRSEDMSKDVRERTEVKMAALKEDYLVKKVERTQWEKVRDQLQTELEQLEGEERAWIAKNEGELNEMLAEYWMMRKQAEDYMNTMTVKLGLKLRTS